MLRRRLAIGNDRFDRAFRLAHPAIDAFVGMDDEHVLALVEAIDRANLDAIHVFAADAGFSDDVGHDVGFFSSMSAIAMGRSSVESLGTPLPLDRGASPAGGPARTDAALLSALPSTQIGPRASPRNPARTRGARRSAPAAHVPSGHDRNTPVLTKPLAICTVPVRNARRQIGAMRLTDEEQAMLAGEFGEPRRWAIAHQIAVGEFFDAADFVPVAQAHIMADTESLGEAGVGFLEGLAALPKASGGSGCRP